ncbi:hypothetical protein M407DRAFT_17655 [Tulasnella calospora MUT 4182]|uniref:Uncharacterized protein n=1 Tax=Tulasnella calospora MUT 4182 TaxID=1051891 RepID=A0A0C3MIA4_9AGAM|nr:hypothetical protein M407DRAFT_17655 [Tulasnella calospora MUT 4182]
MSSLALEEESAISIRRYGTGWKRMMYRCPNYGHLQARRCLQHALQGPLRKSVRLFVSSKDVQKDLYRSEYVFEPETLYQDLDPNWWSQLSGNSGPALFLVTDNGTSRAVDDA